MVSVILDYKKTTQKSPCKICKKLIIKGQCRVKLVGANNDYMRDYSFYHIDCFINKITLFKKEIPDNVLKF
jgi:deoxycytidylate deaminase